MVVVLVCVGQERRVFTWEILFFNDIISQQRCQPFHFHSCFVAIFQLSVFENIYAILIFTSASISDICIYIHCD